MRVVVVYGGDAIRRSIEASLGLQESEYQVEVFGTPGEALDAVYQPAFLERGLLLIGFEFPRSGISAGDLIRDLPLPSQRIIRMSVLERQPFELNGHRCIRPEVRDIRRAIKEASV